VLTNLGVDALAELEGEGADDVVALGAVMLFQNSVAWVKWSSKDCGRCRTTVPLTGRGTCWRPASPTWEGTPPPSELGK